MEELLDIEDLQKDDARRWANARPRAAEVHLWARFPCVHLSRVSAFRQNLDGQGPSLFWKLLTVLDWIKGVFSSFALVKYCIENVAVYG